MFIKRGKAYKLNAYKPLGIKSVKKQGDFYTAIRNYFQGNKKYSKIKKVVSGILVLRTTFIQLRLNMV